MLDGFFQDNPSPSTKGAKSLEDAALRYLALDGFESHLHRWRFNLATGAATEERLPDSLSKFGMMNGHYETRRHRYVYAATGKPGWFLFDGLVKRDGNEARITFGDGVFGSEAALCDAPGRQRRLPRHPDHKHGLRRLLLPGVRCRADRRRSRSASCGSPKESAAERIHVGVWGGVAALAQPALTGDSGPVNAVGRMLGPLGDEWTPVDPHPHRMRTAFRPGTGLRSGARRH